MKFLPDKMLPYAKGWVALLGAVLSSVIATVPELPKWLVILSTSLTAVGVVLTANKDPMAEHQEESVQPPDNPDKLEVIQTSDKKREAAGLPPYTG